LPASHADIKIIQDLLRPGRWEGQTLKSSGELALTVGAYFLKTPYVAGTLEQEKGESLQINLRQLDCFTFVENTMALARLIRLGKSSFADFAASLEAIRYRKGLLDGYSSRLHYFSDWLYDNQKKGWIKDITKEIGGEPFRKQFSFMTANRDKYTALQCPDTYGRIRAVERACSERFLYHLLKARLRTCADKIQNGDLIAVTTDIEGLDVVHAGMAVKIKKSLHLLHASQRAGEVVISGETLYRYLVQRKSSQGIMVARIL